MSERVNEECLDSDASHIGPAAAKEQVISGQVDPCGPALIVILSPHMGVEILLKKTISRHPIVK